MNHQDAPSNTQAAVIVALDLGTSALKAIAVSETGRIVAISRRTYDTHHPHPGWNEQQIVDWWQATTEALQELRRQLPHAPIAAISLTGQMHGTVVLDQGGNPLAPAIIWSDRRAVAERDAIALAIGDALPILIGGPLGAGYQATTLRWLAEHQPEIAESIGTVFLPKDALAHWLTGVRATEPSDAVSTGLLDARLETWEPSLLRATGITASQLPAIVPSGTIIGGVRAEIAGILGLEPGIPVVIGGGDAPCGAIGAGVRSPDQAMLMLSSGAQVILPTADATPDPAGRWHTFPSAVSPNQPGCRRNRVGATSNAGIALEWLSRITQTPVPALLHRAAGVDPGASGALFIPSLTGQRTPVLDPNARGTFFGLTDQQGIPEMARAVAEGIVFACRHAYETMSANRERPARLLVGGGPSQHPLVRQIIADIFGLPVQPLDSPDLTAIGAARLGADALDWPAFRESSSSQAAIGPIPAHRARYDELFAIHVDAAEASRDLSHRLARS